MPAIADPDIFERAAHLRLDLFDLNEHGLWCPACGEILAAPWNIDDDWTPPETCKCGFPDFEDGPGYFTDDGTGGKHGFEQAR